MKEELCGFLCALEGTKYCRDDCPNAIQYNQGFGMNKYKCKICKKPISKVQFESHKVSSED